MISHPRDLAYRAGDRDETAIGIQRRAGGGAVRALDAVVEAVLSRRLPRFAEFGDDVALRSGLSRRQARVCAHNYHSVHRRDC